MTENSRYAWHAAHILLCCLLSCHVMLLLHWLQRSDVETVWPRSSTACKHARAWPAGLSRHGALPCSRASSCSCLVERSRSA